MSKRSPGKKIHWIRFIDIIDRLKGEGDGRLES